MNKRDTVLSLILEEAFPEHIPAAFFLHFDGAYHQGQAAIEKHLEFFRATGMDFVKIQYEQSFPASTPIRRPEDWAHAPLCSVEFFEATIQVVEGLVKAAKADALVIMTLYSPFMWAAHLGDITSHLQENPEAVKKGLEIMTENVLRLVRGCKQAGIDGFYASSQGVKPSGFTIRTFSKSTSSPPIWRCGMNSPHVPSTSCISVTTREDMTT